jgi:hypothetical protein
VFNKLLKQKCQPLSMFYGIIVYLYFMDNKQHHRPHIHAKYQGKKSTLLQSSENFGWYSDLAK